MDLDEVLSIKTIHKAYLWLSITLYLHPVRLIVTNKDISNRKRFDVNMEECNVLQLKGF